jgi:predicted ATP-dependent endonuclease of OLD family
MKITGATIDNYRSIRNLNLKLDIEGSSFCHILAGINESGKSNVLKALALLSKDSKVIYSKDVNKKAKATKEVISVRYRLDESSHVALKAHLASSEVPVEIINSLKINKIDRVVCFDASSLRSDYYEVYLAEKPDVIEYEFSVAHKKFINPSETESEDEQDTDLSPIAERPAIAGEVTPLTAATVTPSPASNPAPLPLDEKIDWESVLEDNFAEAALESLMPKVIFWAYHNKYLINKEINLIDFSQDPAQTSKPLHNVFNLAGYTDEEIASVITDALEDGSLMGELSDKLGEAATRYLEEVWPEHRVSLRVHTAAPMITFHVVEKDTIGGGHRYEIAERSDGFKHFFAILLNLAAENSTDQLKDCLILLDEPEVHLHPSGARFLRDELLKIAKYNTVAYSTHSIFMIDKLCLDRHYKIFKENEATQIAKIDGSNPFKEELIYESLGASIFELISEHNILFEGLTDKKLFDAFTHKYRTDIKPLDINTMCVDGESNFDKYCKFFNKKSVRGYIVTDADTPGLNAKTRILKENPSYTLENTFDINDLVPTGKQSSLEDLLPPEKLQKSIEDFAGITIILNPSKTLAEQLADFNKRNSKKVDINKFKLFVCDSVCSDINKLTKEKAKEKYPIYYEFVMTLHQKIKSV